MSDRFDIFCSYAHADNDDGWVGDFADALGTVMRKLAGQPARIFVDNESIITSDIWKTKIESVVEESTVLLAVLSPSYVRSEWCRREWEMFVDRETRLRQEMALADDQGLVFPILLYPLDRGRFDDVQREFVSTVRARQWLDVSSQLDGTPVRTGQLRSLAEQILDTIAEFEQRKHRAQAAASRPVSVATIQDHRSNLEWSALSPTEMTITEAQDYVSQLGDGWRLPTWKELESLIDDTTLDQGGDSSGSRLREPFNAQRFGYLHSSTPVPEPYRGHYIMNVRNGHIFNGHGYRGHVRAVRPISG